jgi:tetratricopeptide (TPR) repeat protein
MTRRAVTLSLFLVLAVAFGTPSLARKPSGKVLAAAKAHFKQGKAYYEAGAYGDAVKAYEKAYALVPLPKLLFNIGQAYRMQRDKPKAVTAYQRYLAVVSVGTLADEARAHIATLKLKIQVEAAEAAKRKALQAAESARKRAEMLEAARKRAAAEAAARLKAQREDTARLQRIAAQEAERQRRKSQVNRRAYDRRRAQAKLRGRALRGVGVAAIVIGAIVFGGSAGAAVMMMSKDKELDNWESSTDRWSLDWEDKLKQRKLFKTMFLAESICGGVVLILGIVLYRVGVFQRKRATESVSPPVTVTPLLGPGLAGVNIGGRF